MSQFCKKKRVKCTGVGEHLLERMEEEDRRRKGNC